VPKSLSNFTEIGSFDEFVSRTFRTVVVSMAKTKNMGKTGGPLLNSSSNVEFIKSRSTG